MTDLDYIYLASPFNHPDEGVRIKRFDEATLFGFALTEAGLNVYCPITQSRTLQEVATHCRAGITRQLAHEEWMRVDIAFLSKAKLLVVLCLDGWEVSKGVFEETEYAKANGIPMVCIQPTEEFLFSLTKIKVALGLEDVKIGKMTGDPCGKCTQVLTTCPPQYPCQQVKGKIPLTPGMLKSTMEEFGKTMTDALGSTPFKGVKAEQAKEPYKGVKAAQAADKPTTLNFPWTGYGPEDYYLSIIGVGMASIIDDMVDKTHVLDQLETVENVINGPFGHSVSGLQVNEVFVVGMKKHGLRTHLNYDILDVELLVDALGRHILKGLDNLDEESGLPHAAHALANIYMIRGIYRRTGGDI